MPVAAVNLKDHRPEAVRFRMEVYEKSTKPLADYYQQRNLLVTIPADGTPEIVYKRTMTALNGRGAPK